jgi:hypothetical protein
MKVTVPEKVAVRLHLRMGLGDVRLPGNAGSDTDSQLFLDRTTTLNPPYGVTAVGTVDLDLTIGLGDLQVAR